METKKGQIIFYISNSIFGTILIISVLYLAEIITKIWCMDFAIVPLAVIINAFFIWSEKICWKYFKVTSIIFIIFGIMLVISGLFFFVLPVKKQLELEIMNPVGVIITGIVGIILIASFCFNFFLIKKKEKRECEIEKFANEFVSRIEDGVITPPKS